MTVIDEVDSDDECVDAWRGDKCARSMLMHVIFFFFQAEDGIRDVAVTGVQTCALPICCRWKTLTNSRRFSPEARREPVALSSFPDYLDIRARAPCSPVSSHTEGAAPS